MGAHGADRGRACTGSPAVRCLHALACATHTCHMHMGTWARGHMHKHVAPWHAGMHDMGMGMHMHRAGATASA